MSYLQGKKGKRRSKGNYRGPIEIWTNTPID